MGYLIDTSVLIEAERGRLELESLLAGREEEPFFISVITVSELLHGVRRAEDAAVRARRSAFVEAALDALPVLGLDIFAARLHAELSAGLFARGTPVGVHDRWLGATCLAHGLTMATANPRDFGRIPGVEVEVWTP